MVTQVSIKFSGFAHKMVANIPAFSVRKGRGKGGSVMLVPYDASEVHQSIPTNRLFHMDVDGNAQYVLNINHDVFTEEKIDVEKLSKMSYQLIPDFDVTLNKEVLRFKEVRAGQDGNQCQKAQNVFVTLNG